MPDTRGSGFCTLLVTLWLAGAIGDAAAQGVAGPPAPPPETLPVATSRGGPQTTCAACTPDGRIAVMVELTEPPAVEAYLRALQAAAPAAAASSLAEAPAAALARATAAGLAQLARVEQAQRELISLLTSRELGATVLYTVARVYDGVAVEIDPAGLDTVPFLPGVKAVHPLPAQSLDLAGSVPLVNAPAVWNPSGLNVNGEGIRIGIIDSGIDYLHTDFGGPGTGYAANDPRVIGDTASFPGAKVVGGWDFVGDDYDSGSSDAARRIPHPDLDPMDCLGHGTHVASIAAGLGVNGDGSTYTGALGPSTPFASMRIGPGVAPRAKLYALKVFGCGGQTRAVISALDWAADPNADGSFSDRLDVVNMSIGCAYCYPDGDPATDAAERLATLGTIVVWSAGNDGDTTYIAGGRGRRSIVASASVDSTAWLDAFQVLTPASIAGMYTADASSAFKWDDMATPLQASLAYPASQRSGCEAFSTANAAAINGKVALLDWTESACGSAVRADNAANAGARGVILVYPHPDVLDISIAGNARIPAVVTAQDVGNLLKANLPAGITVKLSKAFLTTRKLVKDSLTDTLASFSSRGPSIAGGGLKPDLAAPGMTIFAAKAGSGTLGASLNGTSMAAPNLAGAMALLRQLRPTWTVEELKALALGTAGHDLFSGLDKTPPLYPPQRAGAGRVDLQRAAASQVIAYDANGSGAVGVSFGAPEVLGTATLTRTVKVVNKGATSAVFTVAYRATTDLPGVEVSFPQGSSVTVPAAGSTTFQVRLSATAAQMKHSRDATMASTQDNWPRHWLAEESGMITLTPVSGQALRLPLYAAPRPASAMAAAPAPLAMTAASGRWPLTLTGQGVNTGPSYPTDVRSLVEVFELQATSPDEAHSSGRRNSSDLRYVGVAGDYKLRVSQGKGIADSSVWFAVATQAPWTTPNTQQVQVFIDTNRDGQADYYIANGSSTSISTGGGTGNDAFASVTCQMSSGNCYKDSYLNGWGADRFDMVLFNSSVMWLPAKASRLGLTEGASRFAYWVRTIDWYNGGVIDATPILTYDLTHPGVDAGGLTYWDDHGNTIPVDYNRTDYLANRSVGVLLLHHHNVTENQAQVIAVAPNACTLACTATVPTTALSGALVAFAANVTATSCAGSPTYDWGFGDGSVHATARTASHAFAAAGAYTWTLTVTQDGVTCTRSGTVNVTAAPDPGPYLVSSVAHAPGKGGTQWRTDVAAVNRQTQAAALTLTFLPYGAGATIVKQANLAAGATIEWPDILVGLFKLAATESNKGALKIASTVPVIVTSRTYNQVAAGTYGQYYPAVSAAQALTAGKVGVIPHLTKNLLFRSNVGAQNLGTAPCTVLARLYGATGARVGTDQTRVVGGERYTQWDDIFLLAGAGDQNIAYATVETATAGCRFWAYGSVVDANTGDPTTVPVLTGPPWGPYLIPSVAHAPGKEGTQWRTNVSAVNRNAQATTMTLAFLPYGGGTPIQKPASLAAGATVEWQDILVTLFGLPATASNKGSLEIVSGAPLFVTSRTYNQVASGTYGQYYPALTAVDGTGPGQVGVIPQLKKNLLFRSNIGALNYSSAPCTVLVKLFGASGARVGSDQTRSIGRSRYTQWDDILLAAGAGNQDIAYATVEVQTQGCLAWAYGSVVDASTGDPTTVPVLP